jgi:hypothetical protein
MIKAKDAHFNCPISVFLLLTSALPGGSCENPPQPLETAVVGDGWRGGEGGLWHLVIRPAGVDGGRRVQIAC